MWHAKCADHNPVLLSPQSIAKVQYLYYKFYIVHIITKTFSPQSQEKTDISAQLSYGDNKLIQAQQGFFQKKK